MTIFALALVGLMLAFLVIRFILPELIYVVRQVLKEVRSNKAFLNYEAGSETANDVFVEQLMNDFRFETGPFDEDYALQRVIKLRELYRVLDLRRATTSQHARGLKPQVCIVEIASILGHLGIALTPKVEYNRSIVSATGLLAHIGNEVRRSQGDPNLLKDKNIENFFIEHPMSIEQAIELMIAAVFGLAYRQQAQSMGSQRPSRTEIVDCGFVIGTLEKRIRLMVSTEYRRKYQSEQAVHDRIKQVLGPQVYADCIKRMDKSRKSSPGIALNFVDFLYTGELESLIFGDWDVFRSAFPDKHWLKTRLEKIIPVRNEAAHYREIPKADQMLVFGYCDEIERKIDVFEVSAH